MTSKMEVHYNELGNSKLESTNVFLGITAVYLLCLFLIYHVPGILKKKKR